MGRGAKMLFPQLWNLWFADCEC